MKRNTVAVIVTYNRLEALKLTLKNTFRQAFYKVVVINNCSTDGTQEWLDNFGGYNTLDKDRLIIIHSEKNLGGAGGFHQGFRYVGEQLPQADWLVSFDDDAYKEAHAIEIDASSFVGFFLRLSLIREGHIGLSRSELFIYADDIIYVLEMRKAGFKHLFLPSLIFLHDCLTLIEQRDVYHLLWKVYYLFRNRLEMYRIASGIFYPFLLLVKIPKFFSPPGIMISRRGNSFYASRPKRCGMVCGVIIQRATSRSLHSVS